MLSCRSIDSLVPAVVITFNTFGGPPSLPLPLPLRGFACGLRWRRRRIVVVVACIPRRLCAAIKGFVTCELLFKIQQSSMANLHWIDVGAQESPPRRLHYACAACASCCSDFPCCSCSCCASSSYCCRFPPSSYCSYCFFSSSDWGSFYTSCSSSSSFFSFINYSTFFTSYTTISSNSFSCSSSSSYYFYSSFLASFSPCPSSALRHSCFNASSAAKQGSVAATLAGRIWCPNLLHPQQHPLTSLTCAH